MAIVALCAACGGTTGRPARSGSAEGTTITFEPRVGWPFELESLAVAVDGELAYLQHEAYRRLRPSEVARVPVASGAHTLTVTAVVSHPCAPLSDARQSITLRGTTRFWAGNDAGRVEVRVAARGPGIGPIDERVRLAFAAVPTRDPGVANADVRSSTVDSCDPYEEPAALAAWPVPEVPFLPPVPVDPSL